jgi:hypothetical protein
MTDHTACTQFSSLDEEEDDCRCRHVSIHHKVRHRLVLHRAFMVDHYQ